MTTARRGARPGFAAMAPCGLRGAAARAACAPRGPRGWRACATGPASGGGGGSALARLRAAQREIARRRREAEAAPGGRGVGDGGGEPGAVRSGVWEKLHARKRARDAAAAGGVVAREPAPVVSESTPVVPKSTPAVRESKPVMSESTPVVRESTPEISEAAPVVGESLATGRQVGDGVGEPGVMRPGVLEKLQARRRAREAGSAGGAAADQSPPVGGKPLALGREVGDGVGEPGVVRPGVMGKLQARKRAREAAAAGGAVMPNAVPIASDYLARAAPVEAPVSIVDAGKVVTERQARVRVAVEPEMQTVTDAVAGLSLDSPGLAWLVRVDGSLPKRGVDAALSVRESATRFQLPTVDEVVGRDRLDALVREKGHLPRRMHAYSAVTTAPVALEDVQVDEPDSVEFQLTAENILKPLNDSQRSAVVATPGIPCQVLAGPGSGKTRVLTHRAAYLVQCEGVHPSQIIAVTFTNKAAEEMKNRVVALLEGKCFVNPQDMFLGTFHSICARLLRVHGHILDLESNFDIADATDARAVVQAILREMEPDNCSADIVGNFVRRISMVKNGRGSELKEQVPRREYDRVLEMSRLYTARLRKMNVLDFDDLLVETRRMLNESDDVRRLLQSRYHHVLVDEWQDTNTLQYDIVSILSQSHRNLFVVGDADQSIYRFRGADSRNVLRFGKDFHDAQRVSLVENYRSTRCIVEAAQSVIERNKNRPNKEMQTENEFGSLVGLTVMADQHDEVNTIAKRAKEAVRTGAVSGYSSIAVMYRTNAQSRLFEEALVKRGIPYRLIGGLRFYERQEIKDVMAYVKLLSNPRDDNALKRAINTPPRGIGVKTVEILEDLARRRDCSMLQALELIFEGDTEEGSDLGISETVKSRLQGFYDVMRAVRTTSLQEDENPVQKTLTEIIELTGFEAYVLKTGSSSGGAEKAAERWGNVLELMNASSRYESVEDFLQNVALVSDTGEAGEDESGRPRDAMSLMTLHGGKGLEFPWVFIAGMEDGLVPLIFRDEKSKDAVEEERRLAYVGMTRAKKVLHLSWRTRKLVMRPDRGPTYVSASRSRFLDDVPTTLLDEHTTPNAVESASRSDWGDSSKKRGGWKGKPAKQKSTVTSYGNNGSVLAASFKPKVKSGAECKVGDSIRDSNFGRGVVIGKSQDGGLDVVFANGRSRRVPPGDVEVLYST